MINVVFEVADAILKNSDPRPLLLAILLSY